MPRARDTTAAEERRDLAGPGAAVSRPGAGLALRLSAAMIDASRRTLARLHPELDDEGGRLLWAEHHYGRDLAERVRAHLAARR